MLARHLSIAIVLGLIAGYAFPAGTLAAFADSGAPVPIAVDAGITPLDTAPAGITASAPAGITASAPTLCLAGVPGCPPGATVIGIDPHLCPPGVPLSVGSDGSVMCGVIVPSDKLHDPAENPIAAWQDELGARKDGWPVAVWCALAMLAKTLAYAERSPAWKSAPVIGAAITWLAAGKRAMALAAIGAVAAAVYNTLALGGAWGAALVAAGMAIAGLTHSTTQSASSSSADVAV